MLNTVDDYIEAKLVHSLHTTEGRSFRGCRRRWSYVFQQFYYPTLTPKPLEFGVAFHIGMEKLYDPDTWHDKKLGLALARAAFVKKCDEQFNDFVKHHGEPEPEVRQDYAERRTLGLGMLQYYSDKIIPTHDHDLNPVRVEVKFEVPIKSPDGEQLWCKCDICWGRYATYHRANPTVARWPEGPIGVKIVDEEAHRAMWMGLPVTFGGRIDALMEDENGDYWIFDWKSAAQLTKEENDDYLLLEDQITRYVWALKLLGLPVKGFVYAEIRKAVPTEPEPLKRPYRGRLYSANKQDAYDLEMYVNTVKEGDPNGYFNGMYDEFIEHLESVGAQVFHKRHQVHRNDEELASTGYYIWLEAQEMTNPELRIYPSPGRFGCTTCAFATPCLMTNRGEDVQYYLDSMYEKRGYHYWEEAPPSTDKPGRV